MVIYNSSIIILIGTIGFILYNKINSNKNKSRKNKSSKMISKSIQTSEEKETTNKSIQCDINLLDMVELEIIPSSSKNYRWFSLK